MEVARPHDRGSQRFLLGFSLQVTTLLTSNSFVFTLLPPPLKPLVMAYLQPQYLIRLYQTRLAPYSFFIR